MEKRVWKFQLPLEDYGEVRMPAGAQLLKVAEQHGVVQLWALVNPTAPPQTRKFRIAGTGHEIEWSPDMAFIDTFFLAGGQLVFHVFEIKG